VTAAGVLAEVDAGAQLRVVLTQALEANERLAALTAELRGENAVLRERLAGRDAELEQVRAELAVLQRMVFGRSSERVRPGAVGSPDGGGRDRDRREAGGRRGPGARAGRRDYSHLPRIEVIWDFEGGGYCCPECGVPFTQLGGHVIEQVDWQVVVRRACLCPVAATVMAPGPPKAIGKGLVTNAFIAMLLTERYVAGRSQNSLLAGLARQGADISPATLTGTAAAAGALLKPL
jgi:transposase